MFGRRGKPSTRPVDPQELAGKIGAKPDLIVRHHQAHVEDRRETMIDQGASQHPACVGFERRVGVIPAEDYNRKTKPIPAGGRAHIEVLFQRNEN